jgi:NAD+ kinase
MRIAIYGRTANDNIAPHVAGLFEKLNKVGAELLVYEQFYQFLEKKKVIASGYKTFRSHEELSGKVDYLFSIGGDGTMLETIYLVRNSGIPILGINTGRLGFLASVSRNDIDTALKKIQDKEYTFEKRDLIRLETSNNLFGDVNYALNEITVLKKNSSVMMTIHAFVNGEFLNSYWADGLIIATPTGSTAYSLSCGGPILVPGSENFVITPIAPHNLNVRPIVISDNNVVTLKVEGRSEHYLVSLDSRTEVIDASVELTARKEQFHVNLLCLKGQHFFTTIREKLMWGIDRRN